MKGWYEFPKYLQHPDGRTLKTAAYVLKRVGYETLSNELNRMADQLLAVPPQDRSEP